MIKQENPTPTKKTQNSKVITRVIWLVGSLVIVLSLVVFAGTRHHQPVPSALTTEKPETGQQTEEELHSYKREVTVIISAAGITPQTLNISTNTRINWENRDKIAHEIAITPGTNLPPEFDNYHKIDSSGGYPYVIFKAGTFHYYLVDKPKQGGIVIVKN